jgi:hypothetical protein
MAPAASVFTLTPLITAATKELFVEESLMNTSSLLPAKLAALACGTLLVSGCVSTESCHTSSESCAPAHAGDYGSGRSAAYGGSAGSSASCFDTMWPWGKNHYPATRYAIPDVMPLGSIVRSHWHVMETNAEAADFILHRCDFVDNSSELTPAGLNRISEIAARMPTTPFPVIIQQSQNNSDPELDQIRRDLVVRVLSDLGNPDAARRTFVSQPYSNGVNSMEAEQDFGRFRSVRQNGNNGLGGNGGGGGGGGF